MCGMDQGGKTDGCRILFDLLVSIVDTALLYISSHISATNARRCMQIGRVEVF